jgi:aspartate 1-decarboxylase
VDGTARIQTYAFSGPERTIGINGGAAHLFRPGERLIIAAFDLTDGVIEPEVLLLDESNRIIRKMVPYTTHG